MSTDATCPQCHAKLPPDAPEGLCPRCLIRSVAGLSEPPAAVDVDFPDIGNLADVARRLPQFEIIELLGQGGMGVVYKARQPALDRFVALKILPPADALTPDFLERFRREARALAKLSHPNIVMVHDFGEQGGLYYFVMEYVDGANLRALLRDRKLTPAEALAIVPRVCDALEYAHEEGVIHRDIKPENLLLDKKGRVKIADFGLAKLLRREALDVTLTLSGAQLGTLRYMAPEQIDKPESVDHRADIYSLGVVIYEMLTGEVPMGRFALPSQKAQVDVRLDDIVLRSLERDVERRYQHASEVKTDVEKITPPTGQPAPSPAPPVSPAAPPPRSTFPPPAASTKVPLATIRMFLSGGLFTISSAIFTFLFVAGVFVSASSFDAFFRQDWVRVILMVMQALAIPSGVIMILGARALERGESGLARAGAILGLMPLTPAWLYTLPTCISLLRKGGPLEKAPTAAPAAAPPSEPRLSRLALWGAIWGPCTLFLLPAWVLCVRKYFDLPEEWNSMNSGLTAFGVALFIIAGTAGIGSTLLGGFAIVQIKRSSGKLYGLRLAIGVALLHPLILLGSGVYYAVASFYEATRGPSAPAREQDPSSYFFFLLGLGLALACCFLVGRAVWRAVQGTPRTQPAPAPAPAPVSVPAPALQAWSRLEIWSIRLTALAVIFAVINDLSDLEQHRGPAQQPLAAVMIVAALCTVALMGVQPFRPTVAARVLIPGLNFTLLTVCTCSLPWSAVWGEVVGWSLWQGVALGVLNFFVALILLTTAGGSGHLWRGLTVSLCGIVSLGLVCWWNVVPLRPIGVEWFYPEKHIYYGARLALAFSVLIIIAGAFQLRAARLARS